jgi:hypothetical protein
LIDETSFEQGESLITKSKVKNGELKDGLGFVVHLLAVMCPGFSGGRDRSPEVWNTMGKESVLSGYVTDCYSSIV